MDAAAALEHLVGVQAQAPNAPYVGLWSRLEGFAPAELSGLIEARGAVRMTLMRATVHLVSGRDGLALRPPLQSMLERRFRSSPFARNVAGLDPADLVAAGRAALEEAPRTRTELGPVLAERYPGRDPASLAYAVTYLVPAVQVPPRGLWRASGQARYAPLDSWLGMPLDASTTPQVTVLRYLAAFGPASVADIAVWSGLAGVRELVAPLRPRLRAFRDERGRELLDVEDGPLPDPDTPAPPRFLPEYDNVLLSHGDRARIMDAGRMPPVPPGNGAAAGTVLVDGFMRGTWRLRRAGDRALIEVSPYMPLARADAEAVAGEGERLLELIAEGAGERAVRIAPPAAQPG